MKDIKFGECVHGNNLATCIKCGIGANVPRKKKVMKSFVIGDIHGGYRGLVQVLKRANFDYENDKLIMLGDVTDGWPEVAESIEHLLTIKNLVRLRGNHDDWTLKFMDDVLTNGPTPDNHVWYAQGGRATYQSYYGKDELAKKHLQFLQEAEIYHLDDQNRIFMHAGFDPEVPLDEQLEGHYPSSDGVNSLFFWDRKFWSNVSRGYDAGTENYKEIYIGHTPTISEWKDGKPVNFGNVWNMDTGATYMGKLSMMDIDSKELFQSDPVFLLYPDEMGRNGEKLLDKENWNVWGLFYDDPRYYSTEPGFIPEGKVDDYEQ